MKIKEQQVRVIKSRFGIFEQIYFEEGWIHVQVK